MGRLGATETERQAETEAEAELSQTAADLCDGCPRHNAPP